MDIIRLRTMTWKSKFTQGKYAGLTVEQVFNIGKGKLVWIYYSESTLTFIPEILDAIGVLERDRIEKPGRDIDKYMKRKKQLAFYKGGMIGVYRTVSKDKARERRIARYRLACAELDGVRSRGSLQWSNQHG